MLNCVGTRQGTRTENADATGWKAQKDFTTLHLLVAHRLRGHVMVLLAHYTIVPQISVRPHP